MARGRSVELFFIDGDPEGMRTAEVFNWTGHVFLFPRTRIVDALRRVAARRGGVYLLLGEDESGPLAYIGQSDDIGERIRRHDAQREFWSQAVLITSQANTLNAAHVKYLEARLIAAARQAETWPLDNKNTPPVPGLSEAARENMEAFLDYLFMVLPALRIDIFVQRARPRQAAALPGAPADSPLFLITSPKIGVEARGRLIGSDFVVEAGSRARDQWNGPEGSHYNSLSDRLKKSGVMVSENGFCRFRESYAFTSPSAAAAVVLGYSVNGPSAWKTAAGVTYRDWEAAVLATLPKED